MKKIFVLSICTILFTGILFAQQTEEELFGLLQQGKYKQLVNKVCSLREKEYYKNAFMDYCLAYGYCQLNKPSIAGEWFDHLLASYNNLSTNKRSELQELKHSCTNSLATVHPTDALFSFLRGMSSDGFEGNSAGVESKMGIPSISDKVEEFDFEHLTFDMQNREFSLQQKNEALKYYRKLLANPTIKIDTTEHFLVFYPSNAAAINNHIKQLEEYYAYYNHTFNLNELNRLITVFYCTDRYNFNEVAKRVHNIPVPKSTYGYASSVDLVMLGIASATWLGAMKHELFHLMIRSFVGDIPPWLDEGTACYFESASLKKDSATTNLSRSNYRISLLNNTNNIKQEIEYKQQKEFIIPTLQQLTNYNWQEFSGKPGELIIKASYHQSLSYAFVSFLHEKNLLSNTIEAFRNRSFTEAPLDTEIDALTILHLRSNNELLTNVIGKSIEEIQIEFDSWCKKKNIYRN
jgi:hypothetical protein